jgi:hypothetical protein
LIFQEYFHAMQASAPAGAFLGGGVYAPAGGDFEYVFLNILEILYFFL